MTASDSTRTSITAERTVKAKKGRVFDLLANPDRHCDIDASGMVVSDADSKPVTKVGNVFRMNMRRSDGAGGSVDYQTDNHVTAFEPNRRIAWAVAPADGDLLGWEWRYELEPDGDKTRVSLTYDWAQAGPATVERFNLPGFDVAALEASLALVEKALVKD